MGMPNLNDGSIERADIDGKTARVGQQCQKPRRAGVWRVGSQPRHAPFRKWRSGCAAVSNYIYGHSLARAASGSLVESGGNS